MPKLTVMDLLELQGVRQNAFVQVAREEEALAGTGCGRNHAVGLDSHHIPGIRDWL